MNNILLIILAISVVVLFYLKCFSCRTYLVTLQQNTERKSMIVKARTKAKAYEISSRYLWTHSINYVITSVSNTIYFDKNSVLIIN